MNRIVRHRDIHGINDSVNMLLFDYLRHRFEQYPLHLMPLNKFV